MRPRRPLLAASLPALAALLLVATALLVARPARSADAVRGPTTWMADLRWSGSTRVAHATRERKGAHGGRAGTDRR